MRSFILPLALLVATAAAVPASSAKPEPAECITKGNTVIEIYDATITHTVYVTKDAAPTTRSKHTHKPKTTTPSAAPVYTPPPPPPPVYTPEPEPEPEPVPVPEPPKYEPEPEPIKESPPPTTGLGSEEQSCLDKHNELRARNGAKPLTWNYEAAKWAEEHTKSCVMSHSQNRPGYGENLAFGYGSPAEAIQAWYDEIDSYRANPGRFSMEAGHFTQVVWKATSELGCYNRNCNGRQYLMCEYKSPGNVGGQFEANVQA